MHKVKYIQFRLSNMMRAWVSRKVCKHIMPDYEPMTISITRHRQGVGNNVAINGNQCIGCTINHYFEDAQGWAMTQCLEGASCMNAGIQIWTNAQTGDVVIKDIRHHNMRV